MPVTLFASTFYRCVNALAAHFQRLFELTREPYRPERHYMRGPGPRCRAKRMREPIDL